MKKEDKKRENEEAVPFMHTAVVGQPGWSFDGEIIENLRGLVTRIGKQGSFPARLSLVAALRGEGVTYIAQALASVLVNDLSVKVCLVELNWWWPSPSLQVAPDSPGLPAVLRGETDLDSVILPTGWSNLSFIPAGILARQDRPVLARSQGLKTLIDDLGSRFDHLILDVPAVLATNDAVPLASLGTACCMVVRQSDTRTNDAQQALDEINHLTVLGVVLNRVKVATPSRLVKLVSL